MISVRNRLPQLSGNKRLIVLGIALIIAACSPKVRPVVAPPKTEPDKPVVKPEPPKPKPVPARQSTIAMLLPFALDHLNPGSGYTDISLKQANIALDYYQGFKLALDSLTALGYNYKLHIYDTKGVVSQSYALAYNPQVRASDLIVGPIFPDDLKAFTSVLVGARKPIVSPLAPAAPATIANQNLVTVIPPLEYHAWAAAKYITQRLNTRKVFVLKSGYSEENDYIIPFKNTIDSLSKGRTQVVQTTIVRGRLNLLESQFTTDSPNIIVIPSTNQAFLAVTMRTLDSLSKTYPVILFGHPNWEKFSFLRSDLLQRLRTHITSADVVDYKDAATINFQRAYRKNYRIDPSEYALKGFDQGMYFGKLLGANNGDVKNLTANDFNGIDNDFHFIKKPGVGYINTHVNIMDYRNYELRKIE
ncbi:ABC transporter substrate-binding protein [Mucilaginibacter sp. UYCu711]|uniref:ABC transporter substrate-binding protein n=1 Tax=Mucilaginibacter sp. UYCu711 TaxID=3156339 RepID=UPI003D19695B